MTPSLVMGICMTHTFEIFIQAPGVGLELRRVRADFTKSEITLEGMKIFQQKLLKVFGYPRHITYGTGFELLPIGRSPGVEIQGRGEDREVLK